MIIPIYDENPTRRFPLVTVTIIALNVLVFLYEFSLPQSDLNTFVTLNSVIPAELLPAITSFKLSSPELLTVFTAMFMHGGWLHLGGNMLYLWIFGNNIEDRLGRLPYLLFYLACGIAATGAHVLSGPTSAIPSLGASGAIAGVLGAYLVLYPRARVVAVVPIFFFIQLIRIPAVIVLGFWIIIQLISGASSIAADPTAQEAGVAWFAHIGGFVAGIILILLLPKQAPAPVRRRRVNEDWD